MRARKLSQSRIASAAFDVELIGLEGERLDVPPASFDCAVSTFTLCTIDDVKAALSNVAHALKPGGTFLFLEHGLAPEANVQKWQHRWTPCQSFLFGGCRVNRAIDTIVGEHFEVESVERYYTSGPKTLAYFYRGVARR